ncbi:helix-turn-helix domain-containing protein [uncultured Friedmanniella sp.]|uniref:helix-turn-helix domain-containing protein n=1 Tax=uncultured Friedmanniella sp. TaxID=335381 RepID=UPI0035CBD597
MTTETREPLWRVGEAAAFLGYKKGTVYKKVRAGEVPVRRIGGGLRFDPAELAAIGRNEAPVPRPRAAATPVVVEAAPLPVKAAAKRPPKQSRKPRVDRYAHLLRTG